MKRVLQKNARWVAIILAVVAAAIAVSTYILIKQRLRIPFQDAYTVKAEFVQTAGLTPGLGQAVNVAGVRVGTINGVDFKEGHALATLEIRPGKLPRVYSNAHVTMIPNTPVKDIVFELDPGGPPARPLRDGAVIPVAQTTPQIEADELLAALDTDTRQYFAALIGGLAVGTRGREKDIREFLRNLGPTAEQLRPLGEALVARRRELRRLVHNLAILTKAAGSKDRELTKVVVSANATFQALASQEGALRSSLRALPGTLATVRESLDDARSFADVLAPTARALLPAARELPTALRNTRPLLNAADPILRRQLRPFTKDAQPVARDLGPAVKDLAQVTPALSNAFRVLVYVANELGYNPPGDNEGFLHWLAWFIHNSDSMLSTEDAHGAVWRGTLITNCGSVTQNPNLPLLQTLLAC